MLLSISPSQLLAGVYTKGLVTVREITNSVNDDFETDTSTVLGPTTAPTGQAAIETDVQTDITSDELGTQEVEFDQDYDGPTSAGNVRFDETNTLFLTDDNTEVENVTYTPPQVIDPVSLTAGVPFTTTTSTGPGNTKTQTFDLVSETPSPITVPAGTFSCYEVLLTSTNSDVQSDGSVDTVTTQVDVFEAPGVGLVKLTADEDGATDTEQLISDTSGDSLSFDAAPVDSTAGKTLAPIVVDLLGSDGNIDTNSTAAVTLTLKGGDGTLSGTTTVNAVAGVATFSDLSIDQSGDYTLVVSSPDVTSNLTSSKFHVGGTFTWTGGGDGTSWSDAKNWDQDAAPENGDSLVFPADAPLSPNNNITGLKIDTIDIQGGGYTLTGNPISLTGGLTSEAGNNTYNIDTTLVGSPTLDDQTGDLTIASVFSGDSLTISGTGTDSFDQADTYTGTTTLSPGVTIDDDVADGVFGNGDVTIDGGAAPVTIADTDTGVDAVILENDLTLEDGSTLAIDPDVDGKGALNVPGTATLNPIHPDDAFTLDADLLGGGTLVLDGLGKTVVKGNVAANTQIVVEDGEVDLGANLKATSSPNQIAVVGGTLKLLPTLTGQGGIEVDAGTLVSGGASGYSGTITLEPTSPEADAAVVQLTGGDDDLGTGTTVIAAGPVEASVAPLIDTSGSGQTVELDNQVTLKGGSVLTTKGDLRFGETVSFVGSAEIDTSLVTDDLSFDEGIGGVAIGTLTLDGPGTTFVHGDVSPFTQLLLPGKQAGTTGDVDLLANLQMPDLGSSGPNQVIIGGGTVDLDASGTGPIDLKTGTLKSGAANGYSGTIYLEQSPISNPAVGQVIITPAASQDPLGSGPLVVASPTSAEFTPVSITSTAAAVLANDIIFMPNSALTTSGTLVLSGADTLNGPAEVDTAKTADHLTLGGDISGAAVLTVGGPGLITVNGSVAAGANVIGNGTGTFELGAFLQGPVTGPTQVTAKVGKLSLLSALNGFGGIDVQSGTVQSEGLTDFGGTITLEATDPADPRVTASLSAVSFPLGSGTLVIGIPSAGQVAPLIDASGSQAQVALKNALGMGVGAILATKGKLDFLGNLTLLGAAEVDTTQDSDSVTYDGDVNGPGILTVDGPGLTIFNGDISSVVQLVIAGKMVGPMSAVYVSGALQMPDLGDSGPSQVLVQGGTFGLTSTTSGSGRIDVQSGKLITDTTPNAAGTTAYTGTIVLETDGTIELFDTKDANGLGKGTLELNGGTVQNASTGNTVIGNPITLNGTVALSSPNTGVASDEQLEFAGQITVAANCEFQLSGIGNFMFDNLGGNSPLVITGNGQALIAKSVSGTVFLKNTGDDFLAGNVSGSVVVDSASTILHLPIVDGFTPLQGTGEIDVFAGTLETSQSTPEGYDQFTGNISASSGATVQDFDSSDVFGLGKGTLELNGGTLENQSGGSVVLSNSVEVLKASTISAGQRLKVTGSLLLQDTLTVNGTLALTGPITGSGDLSVNNGELDVAGSNPTYSGAVTVGLGIAKVTTDHALGTGPFGWDGDRTKNDVLEQVGSIGDPILDNPLTVIAGTLVLDGQFTFPAGITVDAGATLDTSTPGTEVVDSGPLSGDGTIVSGGNFSATGDTDSFTGTIQNTGSGPIPPITSNGSYSTDENAPLTVTTANGVLANDIDLNDLPLSAVLLTNPTSGTLTLNSDGSFTYVPNADFNGADSFTYEASDGTTESSPTTVTLNVTFVNQPPTFTAVNPPAVTENSGPQSISPFAVFNPGAADESDQSVLGYTVSNVSNPALFSVLPTVANDGTLSYTPAAGASGTSTFSLAVQDNGGTANGGLDTSFSQTFTITVNPIEALLITANPSNQGVSAGNTATFTAAASGDPTPIVEWQVSTDGGHTFSNIPSATSTTYSFTATADDAGDQYKAVFFNGAVAVTTPATLTIIAVPSQLAITSNPVNQIVSPDGLATFHAAATGSPTPIVNWQVSTDGGHTFSNIPGAISPTFSFTATAAQSGAEYKAVFFNGDVAITTPATLTVTGSPVGLVVTSNPTDQSVSPGALATFTAAASGIPAPIVAWQVSTDGGHTFTNIPGATSTAYSFIASANDAGDQYKAIFFNGNVAVTSPAKLTLSGAFAPPVITADPSNQNVTAGSTATFIAAATGDPTPIVEWQVSTDGGLTFSNIPGATSTTYSFTATADEFGDEYKAVFFNGGVAVTSPATLT